MKRHRCGVLVVACLLGMVALNSPAVAANVNSRVAKTSCTTMGLTLASLRPYFGTVTLSAAGYECGLISDAIEATLYIYPLSEKAAATKELGVWRHPTRLGGLGAGAEFFKGTDGGYGLKLSSGTHFVYIDGQAVASQGKLITLAHIIYRALA
jgi:hypothetical protein